MGVVDRHMQSALVPIFNGKLLLPVLSVCQTTKAPDSVVGMDNKIAFVELIQFGSCGMRAHLLEAAEAVVSSGGLWAAE